MAIAGHVNRAMLEHYSHVRQEAKRRAVKSLDTSQLAKWERRANPREEPKIPGKEQIKLVGAIGFEPTTPCAQGRCATRLRYAPTFFIINELTAAPFSFPGVSEGRAPNFRRASNFD